MGESSDPQPDEVRTRSLERLEILDALVAVLDRREEFLQLVSAAASADAARDRLGAVFGFNEVQAVAALDLQVRRFARTERGRITDEREELRQFIGSA